MLSVAPDQLSSVEFVVVFEATRVGAVGAVVSAVPAVMVKLVLDTS